MKTRTLFAAMAAVLFLSTATPCFSKPFSRTAALLGASDSVLVKADDGRVLFSWKPDAPRVPASTLKVLTCLAAMKILGPDHRFATELYSDGKGTCALKGYGDPLLLSKVLREMAGILALKVPGCKTLVLDDGFFQNPVDIPGAGDSTNPYDAPVGALCANFNTVNFTRNPKTGELKSVDSKTPLVPFAKEIIREKRFPRGLVVLTHDCRETSLYAGHLFARFYEQAGGGAIRDIEAGKAGPGFSLVHTHSSPFNLTENVRLLLRYSNNFMTNQILLAMGAKRFGAPANLEKGVSALEEFARDEVGLKQLQIAEGSGLARENRITASEMMKVLDAFEPYMDLLKENHGVRYKTGTLKGVSGRVGYVRKPGKIPSRFVILVNTPRHSAQKILDSVLRELPPPGKAKGRS